MSYAILFSSQGAQRSGMGVELMADSLFSKIVQDASEICDLDLLEIMKNEQGQLEKTEFVQPALVTVSYGIYRMLERDLPKLPLGGMIGLSLGEYAALLASHAIGLEEGLSLLVDRARYMQADADKTRSSMAAIMNPKIAQIEELISSLIKDGQKVYIANYNSPKQLVIGGTIASVNLAVEKIKQGKLAKRAIILKVNGAFHTPLFNGARDKMHDRLAGVSFKNTTVPVISNTTVEPFTSDNINGILERQLAVPTHFGEDLQYLRDHQTIKQTLEIGPGKTLTSFAKQVDSSFQTSHISNLDDYNAFIKERQDEYKE